LTLNKRVGKCDRCGACCLYLWYDIPMGEDGWWRERGALVFPDPFNPKNQIVGAPAPCQHIHHNDDGTTRCDIYDTDKYPEGCRRYPPEVGPNAHFVCIKKSLGCGFDYVTVEEKKKEEEKKMPITYRIEKEEADRILKEYTQKAHSVYEGLLNEAGAPGCFMAQQIFRDLIQEAERKGSNIATLDTFNDMWIENFKNNLMSGQFKDYEGRWICREMEAKNILCVGAGPSLTDEQVDAMKDFKGTIICVNKSAKKLYERGVIPTIVTCIHGTNEVLPSFQNDVVRKNIHKSHVVLSTDVTPDVVKEVKEHCDLKKLWFFHSSVPSELVTNLDTFFQAMVDFPVLDTGGNVGLFNIALAQRFIPKVVGFVGMELCLSFKDAIKTNEHMMDSTLLRWPDDDNQEFVLDKIFRGYVQVLMNWYGEMKAENKDQFPFELINCTPRGLIYIHRKDWIPYMPLEEFIAKCGV